ncbi:Protein of unknown function DUF3675 [Macleaya cordata]|uniref:Uncharacterized protein n=1 Tax=Macleaya cordata TaxID=56857 RepID=A0A200PWH5_MACCD|nr:Protein of unknown function DUF3675 [Macleaya cordata]
MAIIDVDTDYSGCSSAAERSASCFRFVAIIFTILLLVRHLLFVLTSGTEHYAFTLLTVLILRAGGILIPLYVMVRAIETIQNRLQQLHNEEFDETSIMEREEEEHEPQYPTVQIQS